MICNLLWRNIIFRLFSFRSGLVIKTFYAAFISGRTFIEIITANRSKIVYSRSAWIADYLLVSSMGFSFTVDWRSATALWLTSIDKVDGCRDFWDKKVDNKRKPEESRWLMKLTYGWFMTPQMPARVFQTHAWLLFLFVSWRWQNRQFMIYRYSQFKKRTRNISITSVDRWWIKTKNCWMFDNRRTISCWSVLTRLMLFDILFIIKKKKVWLLDDKKFHRFWVKHVCRSYCSRFIILWSTVWLVIANISWTANGYRLTRCFMLCCRDSWWTCWLIFIIILVLFLFLCLAYLFIRFNK